MPVIDRLCTDKITRPLPVARRCQAVLKPPG
jgi:hypothetical protein